MAPVSDTSPPQEGALPEPNSPNPSSPAGWSPPPAQPQWPQQRLDVPPTGQPGQHPGHPGYPGYPAGWQPPGVWRPLPPPVAPNGQPLANFGDRFLAYLIDYAIHVAVSLIWTVPLMIWWFSTFFDFMREYGPDQPYAPAPPPRFDDVLQMYIPMFVFWGVSLLLGMIFTYLYFAEYQYRRGGQTVGKRAMKLRVIPVAPEKQLTRGDMVKRWAVQYVAGPLVPFLSLIDGLWQLWDKPLQQCLHDKVAATVVVKVG
jgi:uncharacterized RDD family membrane protein YckC